MHSLSCMLDNVQPARHVGREKNAGDFKFRLRCSLGAPPIPAPLADSLAQRIRVVPPFVGVRRHYTIPGMPEGILVLLSSVVYHGGVLLYSTACGIELHPFIDGGEERTETLGIVVPSRSSGIVTTTTSRRDLPNSGGLILVGGNC